jgi:hypothetical protein
MPHTTPPRRKRALVASPIPLAALFVAAALGLAACGGSSSTTTTTTNAAATNAPAATSTGSSSAGSAGSSTSTTGGVTGATPGRPNSPRFSAMRECLAKKGITLPQRTPGSPGGFAGGAGRPQLPKGMSRTQLQEAFRSCGGSFTGGRLGPGRFGPGHSGFTSPRFHTALVRFATCLRQNGVNVGEPNTSGKGPVFDTKGINTGSPQFKTASIKCRSVLFAGRPKVTPGTAGAPPGAAS